MKKKSKVTSREIDTELQMKFAAMKQSSHKKILMVRNGNPCHSSNLDRIKNNADDYQALVFFTRELSDDFYDFVLENKRKTILHVVVSGFPEVYQPNLMDTMGTLTKAKQLIDDGFPSSQMCIRIDPLVPEMRKEQKEAIDVLKEVFTDIPIQVRLIWYTNYSHYASRFDSLGIVAPDPEFSELDMYNREMVSYIEDNGLLVVDCKTSPCVSVNTLSSLGLNHALTSAIGLSEVCNCLTDVQIMDSGLCDNGCVTCKLLDRKEE